ncbi:unnamed protein product [Darwinula stevensoni]|uniref:Protein kinase domain-containing protein n=1 Tax=Darwinula stevensoni TaxID=69355 RepID=A0A7R8XEH1_9CRUS|nr:unnamed protein product [Darwinula stevensoni]CAG0889570.1 unnamed protein product [Darwinula stevensoni]
MDVLIFTRNPSTNWCLYHIYFYLHARPLGESGISAIAASGFEFVAFVVCSIYYYRFRKEKARNIALSNEETEIFLKVQPGSLNSAMGLSEQAHLPLDVQWDFPPEKLKLGKLLGSGEFGYVLKAVAIGIRPPEPETTVAVKKRKPRSSLENYQALMMEVKIMSHLGMHLNVVNFLGACTKNLAHVKQELLLSESPYHLSHLSDLLSEQWRCVQGFRLYLVLPHDLLQVLTPHILILSDFPTRLFRFSYVVWITRIVKIPASR